MKRPWRPFASLAAAAALLAVVAVAGAANVDTQANQPQVAGDPLSNTTAVFPTNKQNEPSIAVNPIDSTKLISGSNDEQLQPPCGPGPMRGATAPANDCSFFPNVGTDGVYTSSDGGGTWVNGGLLPGYSDNGGPLISDGDPVIVYGPKPDGSGGFSWSNGARAYYGSLASYATGSANGNQAPELIAVSRSDDNGAIWSNPVVGASAHGHVFNDKDAMWADANEASPFFGRVYISWTQFRSIPGTAEPIMTAYSADGGLTWSTPKQVSAAHNNAKTGGRQFSALRTGPDGTLYLLWEDGDINGSAHKLAVSRDGGNTWSRPGLVGRVDDIRDPIPGANFRDGSYPSIAVNQSNGAVYVSWADELGGNTGKIVVTKSSDRGRTWSSTTVVSAAADGYAFFQGLDVAPNGRIDIGYQSLKAVDTATYGTGNALIDSYYVQSTNGGASWSAPVKVSVAPSDPAASAQNNLERQFWGDYNTLVSTNTQALFIYTDTRNGAGCPAVDAYQHSIDAGAPIAKPAPEAVCAAQFGNSDVFAVRIGP